MRISDVYGGEYLTAAEIGDARVQVTVDRVGQATFNTPDGEERKAVLYFAGKGKGLALNRTNATILAQAWGDDTDAWVGYSLTLFTERTTYMGRPCRGLRVEPIQAKGD